MSTADILLDKSLELARADAPQDQAVEELLECCGNHRVSAVIARDRAHANAEADGADPTAGRAAGYLDAMIERMPEMM
jgi:hypothetical protein